MLLLLLLLPSLPHSALLTESSVSYSPPFRLGLLDFSHTSHPHTASSSRRRHQGCRRHRGRPLNLGPSLA